MAEIAALVGRELKDQATAMTAAANKDLTLVFSEDYYADRKPDLFVYLYNTSEQSWEGLNAICRPPTMPVVNIKAKAKGEEYALVAVIPSPIYTSVTSVDSGEVFKKPLDGRRFAMDIINPDNLGLDQSRTLQTGQDSSAGTNNLGNQGLFWSENNPPKAEEVKAAVARMEAYYNAQIEKIDAIASSNPAELKNYLLPVHHRACEYFGLERSWHSKNTRPETCPNCSETVKAGIAFHRDSSNELCIINWEKTVRAGKKTVAEAEAAGVDTSKWSIKRPAPVTK